MSAPNVFLNGFQGLVYHDHRSISSQPASLYRCSPFMLFDFQQSLLNVVVWHHGEPNLLLCLLRFRVLLMIVCQFHGGDSHVMVLHAPYVLHLDSWHSQEPVSRVFVVVSFFSRIKLFSRSTVYEFRQFPVFFALDFFFRLAKDLVEIGVVLVLFTILLAIVPVFRILLQEEYVSVWYDQHSKVSLHFVVILCHSQLDLVSEALLAVFVILVWIGR